MLRKPILLNYLFVWSHTQVHNIQLCIFTCETLSGKIILVNIQEIKS